jgi:Protein of unknown function (DUF3014)
MRPARSILDASFRYVPSFATSVARTWQSAGWRPTTHQERMARQRGATVESHDESSTAMPGAPAFTARWQTRSESNVATPDVEGPIEFVQPRVKYEFADAQLEALSAGDKIMSRMGADAHNPIRSR